MGDFYKVVSRLCGEFTSMTRPFSPRSSPRSRVYEIDHTITPASGCGPLCAFRFLQDAIEWAKWMAHKAPVILQGTGGESKETTAWDHRNIRSDFPSGTVLLDWFIPKRVETYIEDVSINEK